MMLQTLLLILPLPIIVDAHDSFRRDPSHASRGAIYTGTWPDTDTDRTSQQK